MIKRLFLSVFLVLCLASPGSAADGERVIQGLDVTGAIQWGTGGTFATPYENTITVAESGGDYTTIQAALTANATANTLFIVYPGTYVDDTINFTANNQYVIGFPVSPKVVLITKATGICDFGAFTGCIVKDVKMVMTLAANAYDDCVTGTGSCNFKFVHAETIASGGAPGGGSTVYSGTGDFKIVEGSIVYTNSATRGAQGKKAVLVGTGSTFIIDDVTFTVTGSSTSSTMSAVRSNLVGDVTVDKCSITVTDNGSDATYALSIVNGTGTAEMAYNTVHVSNSANDAAGMYAAGGGAGISIRSMYNHVHAVAGSGTANSIVLANSDTTVVSQFDDFVALGGVSNTGGSFTIASSEADGSLTLTSDLDVGGNTTLGDAAADSLTINATMGADKATFQNTADSTTGFQVLDADGGVPVLNVDTTNERIGIGTNAPVASLDIVSGNVLLDKSQSFAWGSSSANTAIRADDAPAWLSARNNVMTFDTYGTGTVTDGAYVFRTNSVNLMTIEGDTGNVGIGTATPKSKLDVEGSVAIGATYSGTTAAPANGLLVEGLTQFGTAAGAGQVNVQPTTAINALAIKTQEAAGATDGIVIVDSADAEIFAVDSDGAVTATSFTADHMVVSTKTDSYVVLAADFGTSLRMNSADDKNFTLPSVGTTEDGARLTFIKQGAGKMTMIAVDTDYIDSSSATGTIYTTSAYATITLEYVHGMTRWVIISAAGTFTSS